MEPGQLLASDGRQILRRTLVALLRPGVADEAALERLGQLSSVHGWPLPQLARREGGLWLLEEARLRELRRRASATQLAAAYDTHPFAALFSPPIAEPAAAEASAWESCGALPSVDWPQEWQTRGQALVRAGMACKLTGCGLFPVGMRRWGRRDFLEDQLRRAPCHVMMAPRARKRFSYWNELSGAASDRVDAGYRFTPPVRSMRMGAVDFFRLSRRAEEGGSGEGGAGECFYLQHEILQPAGMAGSAGMAPTAGIPTPHPNPAS